MNRAYTTYKNALTGSNSRGRVSKARYSRGNSSASTRRRTATTSRQPYTPVEYPREQCLYFNKIGEWDPARLVKGIKMIKFSEDFDVQDCHLDAIIATGPAICNSLLDFRAGDSETGQGAKLSDAGIERFAAACPNLVHVSLDGTKLLSGVSFLAILSKCTGLRYLQLSGNDKVTGCLGDDALNDFGEKPDWGKKLVKIRLTDQFLNTKALKSLSAKRKKLAIEDGCTRERGGGVNTWLGGKLIFGYQAFGGPGGFNQYGGFGPF